MFFLKKGVGTCVSHVVVHPVRSADVTSKMASAPDAARNPPSACSNVLSPVDGGQVLKYKMMTNAIFMKSDISISDPIFFTQSFPTFYPFSSCNLFWQYLAPCGSLSRLLFLPAGYCHINTKAEAISLSSMIGRFFCRPFQAAFQPCPLPPV